MQKKRKQQLSQVQSALIALLSNSVFGAKEIAVEIPDPELLLEEAEKQTVFPYVFQALTETAQVDPGRKWTLRFQKHLVHNLSVISLHFKTHELLTEAGIPYTVLKGCASGRYYPAPEMRTMGDVDIYVEQSSMQSVSELFRSEGYQVSNTHHGHHWAFSKANEEIEVHWQPSGIPAADDGTIRSLFDDLLAKRFLDRSFGSEMYLPDPVHHGLVLLLHTANHLSAGGIGLRHLIDWLVFVFSMPEKSFRELLEQKLRQIGLWQFACVLTSIGVRFFSCEPRDFCADVSADLALQILLDIFAGGNFGIKDNTRYLESKLLRDEQTREIDGGGRFRHLLRFMNRKAQLALPITKKLPVLLPIGWVKAWILHMRAKDKVKYSSLDLRGVAKSAKERELLYKQLQLFKV